MKQMNIERGEWSMEGGEWNEWEWRMIDLAGYIHEIYLLDLYFLDEHIDEQTNWIIN